MADIAHGATLAAAQPVAGPDRFEAGAVIGDYVIERFIGGGAMGEVYAGHQPTIGKRVAIKVLRRELAASAEAAERFIREARAVNQIDHPNVIDVFAFGRLDDGRLYLVMDLVGGQSLRAKLGDGAMQLAPALEILDAIAGALDAAHARGVVHRDLKPDNIVLSESDHVFVLDFGIAKLVSVANAGPLPATLTGQGTWLGTPGYMAPEQWSVDGAGPASDRYALGVIAFELLAGALPFSASSVPAMMEQHFRADVPALSGRGLPPAIDGVLRRAMAKDPDARFPTARAMTDALRAAAGTGIGARGALATPGSPRRSWIPALAGVGVLGVAIVVVIATRAAPPRAAPAGEVAMAPEGTITVNVISTPDHAELTADDRALGATPKSLHLRPGETVAIAARLPGYLPERRTITSGGGVNPPPSIFGASADVVSLVLVEVTRFQGTWRMANGELRAFERNADQVDVYKLDEIAGPRHFYKHYAFAAANAGVAFAADDEVIDPRAPDDPRCHVPVHVEYRYDPSTDKLELCRPKLKIDMVDGHCVAQSHDVEVTQLVRVDAATNAVEILAPAGMPQYGAKSGPKPKSVSTAKQRAQQSANAKKQAFDTVGKKPTSPYIDTKSKEADNMYEGDLNANQAPPQDPPQAPSQQAAPQQAPQQQAPQPQEQRIKK